MNLCVVTIIQLSKWLLNDDDEVCRPERLDTRRNSKQNLDTRKLKNKLRRRIAPSSGRKSILISSYYVRFVIVRWTSYRFSVDKKNQLDVTFYIIYFSSNSCSTCFGQPCAHHQELTTAWCYSLVLVCAVTICGFI